MPSLAPAHSPRRILRRAYVRSLVAVTNSPARFCAASEIAFDIFLILWPWWMRRLRKQIRGRWLGRGRFAGHAIAAGISKKLPANPGAAFRAADIAAGPPVGTAFGEGSVNVAAHPGRRRGAAHAAGLALHPLLIVRRCGQAVAAELVDDEASRLIVGAHRQRGNRKRTNGNSN